MLRVYILILLLFGFISDKGYAQLNYQISNYDIASSGAGNQNWDIDIDEAQKIYIANNFGLLVLENTNISLHQLSDQTIFRSVEYIDGKIYTGSFEDFGFWTPNSSGELSYTSLTPLLEDSDMNNDEIWKIVDHQGVIYFHSFGDIYTYDGSDVNRLGKDGSFMFPYKIHGNVFLQKIQGGLYQIKDGVLSLIPNSAFLGNEEVKAMIELPNNKVLIGTTLGLYIFDGNTFEVWKGNKEQEIKENNLNVIVKTEDKIIIGTILNGLYIYNFDFEFLEHINTENQLQNNTILSLGVDMFNNIWVGMDNGLSYLSFDDPIHIYQDRAKGIGSSYAAALFGEELYVGTNQGIYVYQMNESKMFTNPQLIPNSQGQVWLLKEFDGKLYAGTNDGTYTIENKSLKKISSIFGGYTLKPYSNSGSDVLLQSTYSDILVYKKESEQWNVANALMGFTSPARYMEFDYLGNIWLGHTVKGIFKIQPNIKLDSIEQIKTIGDEEGLNTNSNGIFKLENRIITSTKDSLFEWDTVNEKFVPFTMLNPFFTETGSVNNIFPAGDQRYWVVKHSEINLFEVRFDSVQLIYRLLPGMYNFSLVDGYETVIPLSNELHLICLDEGFAILNLATDAIKNYPTPEVFIQQIRFSDSEESDLIVDTNLNSTTSVKNRNNNAQFKWTSTQSAGAKIFFQYKLDGLEKEWSSWTTQTIANYERLQPGLYSFLARSIDTNGFPTKTVSYSFTIKEPLYLTHIAFFFYMLILLSLGFMSRLYVSRKRWRSVGKKMEQKTKQALREQEKAEKEIIKLNNEKLQSEVEHKSAQLASNTMAIMRKNNLLSSLKDELAKQKKELGKQIPSNYFIRLNKLIDKGIDDEHEWEVFEQLYDQAHGNFFKRLKETYPQLTPSDLRLCAYLRMNLASKEIAPLLNISVRGVEERRYRLRKRLDISTNTNLTELIMTF